MMNNAVNAADGMMGYFGNIWIRKNVLLTKGDINEGHKHHFDHVTLLVSGTVKVYVDGFEPTVYEPNTFIIIKKEYNHTFEALTDNCVWFCLIAMRDPYGEVIEDPTLYTPANTPYRPPIDAGGMSPYDMDDMKRKQNIINTLMITEEQNNANTP